MCEIETLVEQLQNRDTKIGCNAMAQLREISETSGAVYPYFDRIAQLLTNKNSYCRNRALALLAANAKWDTDRRTEAVLPAYLACVQDEKPITARQCIQNLPLIAEAKPELIPAIVQALMAANPGRYNDSMQPLVERDIQSVLAEITALQR